MYRAYDDNDDFAADSEIFEGGRESRRRNGRTRRYSGNPDAIDEDEELLDTAESELSEPIDGEDAGTPNDVDTEGDDDIKRAAHDLWRDDYEYISEVIPCDIGCWGAIVKDDSDAFHISLKSTDSGVELLPDEWASKTYDDDESAESDLKNCLKDVIKAKNIQPDIRIDEAIDIIFEKNADHIINS